MVSEGSTSMVSVAGAVSVDTVHNQEVSLLTMAAETGDYGAPDKLVVVDDNTQIPGTQSQTQDF